MFGLFTNGNTNTIIFVTALRLDLASHGFVVDAQALTLSEPIVQNVKDTLVTSYGELRLIQPRGEEAIAWKQLLPALAERCRTWNHGQNCEYLATRKVPLSLDCDEDPLRGCGKGKAVTPEFRKGKAWRSAIPYVTRIAIGPLYGVPYRKPSVTSPGLGWRQQNHRSWMSSARSVVVLGNPSCSFAVVVKVSAIVLLIARRRIGKLRELVVNNP